MNTKLENIITYSLIGVAAYILTDIIHEVLGHSFITLILGHHITLLSSVYFRSNPGSSIIDVTGPICNLLSGLLFLYILKRSKELSVLARLLTFLLMSYNFYWFSGTLLQSSLSVSGDWTYIIQQHNLGIFGTILLVMFGIITYYHSIKFCKKQINEINFIFPEFPLREFIYYSYVGATVSAIIAGLFFGPNRFIAAREGFYEMLASIPIVFIVSKNKINVNNYIIKSKPITFNIIVILLFIVFCFTLGRGFISN